MRHRLVYFEPDPFTGRRYVLGAQVDDGKRVKGLPLPYEVAVFGVPLGVDGSRAPHVLVSRLLDHLAVIDVPSGVMERPVVFGPLVTLGPVRGIPAGVDDPHGWVLAMLDLPGVRRGVDA